MTGEMLRQLATQTLFSSPHYELTVGQLASALATALGAWALFRLMPRFVQLLVSVEQRRLRTTLLGRGLILLGGSAIVLMQLGLELSAVLQETAFTIADRPISIATLLLLMVLAWVASVIARSLGLAIATALRRGGVKDAGAIALTQRLVQYGSLIFAGMIGLQTIGIDLGALVAASAVFAVGLSFALQTLAQDFVAGLVLTVERSIHPGDVIEVQGQVVQVVQVGTRATHVLTRDDSELMIPNSVMIGNAVNNQTMTRPAYRVRVKVGLAYDTDPREARAVLTRVAEQMGWSAEGHKPRVLLRDFGASSVDWDVSVWTSTPWRTPQHASELREHLWHELRAAGLVIAFPQLDVHFDHAAHKERAAR